MHTAQCTRLSLDLMRRWTVNGQSMSPWGAPAQGQHSINYELQQHGQIMYCKKPDHGSGVKTGLQVKQASTNHSGVDQTD